jgi:hypothetical protein
MTKRQQYGNTVSTLTAQKGGTERAVERVLACTERLASRHAEADCGGNGARSPRCTPCPYQVRELKASPRCRARLRKVREGNREDGSCRARGA